MDPHRSPFADGWQFLKFTAPEWPCCRHLVTRGANYRHHPGVRQRCYGHEVGRFLTRAGIIAIVHDALSVFLLVPLLLAPWDSGAARPGPARSRPSQPQYRSWPSWSAWLSFHGLPAAIYLAIPLALVAAIVCGARGVAASVLIVSSYGMAATARGFGPFVMHGPSEFQPIFEMGIFAFCLGIPGMFAGITLDQLRHHRNTLEERIALRTSELAQAKEKAEAAGEAKSEFLASMSHEIRYADERRPGLRPPARPDRSSNSEHGADASIPSWSSGEMLLALLNDVLDLSKIEAGAIELDSAPVNLRRMVPDVLPALRLGGR